MKECSYNANDGYKKDFNSLQKMAKSVLEVYRPLKAHLKILDKQMQEFENDGIKGISFDKISSCPTNDIKSLVETIAIKNIEEVDRMREEKRVISSLLSIVEEAVNSLKEDERRIIELYYFESKRLRFWQIGMIIQRNEFYIMNRLHPFALRQIGLALRGFSADIEKWVKKG